MPLIVEEYSSISTSQIRGVGSIAIPIPDHKHLKAVQHVAIGGSSEQSSAFDAETRFIAATTDADCYIQIGADPTATTSAPSIFLPSGATRFLGVRPGNKVGVIEA